VPKTRNLKSVRRILVASLTLAASPALASDVVKEFSGTGNMMTPVFTVKSPWILDWRLNGDYETLLALDIMLVEARTGKHVGRVLHTKYRGNGVKLFNEGGSYQLRVSATLARWNIKIEQLTDEEAELYTPRKQKKAATF
jgi:hypothetical protein